MDVGSRRSTPLSPVDRIFLGPGGYPIQFLLRYKENLDVAALQRGLDQELFDEFWPLRSTIVDPSGGVDAFAGGSNRGGFAVPLVVERDLSETITIQAEHRSALPSFEEPSELADFLSSNTQEDPVQIRLVTSPDGCILSCSISHCLVDGYSYFYFLCRWALTVRDHGRASRKTSERNATWPSPQTDRSVLRPLSPQKDTSGADIWPDELRFFRQTGLALAGTRPSWDLSRSRWEFLRFPKVEVDALCRDWTSKGVRVSSHDYLCALLWKKVAQEWHAVDGERLTLASAFDFRRLRADIGSAYFGNAIRAAGTDRLRGEVLSARLEELALSVRESTAAITTQAVDATLGVADEFWRKHGQAGAARIHVSHPVHGLLVTNLSRIPLSEIDFGNGKPAACLALTPVPRAAVITPDHHDYVIRLSLPE